MALLLVATVLGVYKRRGLTPYGWRKQQEGRGAPAPQPLVARRPAADVLQQETGLTRAAKMATGVSS